MALPRQCPSYSVTLSYFTFVTTPTTTANAFKYFVYLSTALPAVADVLWQGPSRFKHYTFSAMTGRLAWRSSFRGSGMECRGCSPHSSALSLDRLLCVALFHREVTPSVRRISEVAEGSHVILNLSHDRLDTMNSQTNKYTIPTIQLSLLPPFLAPLPPSCLTQASPVPPRVWCSLSSPVCLWSPEDATSSQPHHFCIPRIGRDMTHEPSSKFHRTRGARDL